MSPHPYTKPRLIRLSRALAHALRHAPQRYDLDVDEAGWASIDDLLHALKKERAWKNIKRADLEDMIAKSAKTRYEISGDRIRALNGPSLPDPLVKRGERPPLVLYHGTDPESAARIRVEGLSCMERRPVHLATTPEEALEASRLKGENPIILNIQAHRAYECGISFYRTNDHIWLADKVPPEYIS